MRYTYTDTLSKKLSQTSMHTTNKVVLSNFFENSVMAWIMFLKETHFGLKRISEIVLCSDFTECWLSKNYVVTPSNWICLRTWYNINDYKLTKILACIYISDVSLEKTLQNYYHRHKIILEYFARMVPYIRLQLRLTWHIIFFCVLSRQKKCVFLFSGNIFPLQS